MLKKERWDDTLLFLAQDRCFQERLRTNRAVQRLFVMGFVKVRLPALDSHACSGSHWAAELRLIVQFPYGSVCADHVQPQRWLLARLGGPGR